jgi:hypothetical protein
MLTPLYIMLPRSRVTQNKKEDERVLRNKELSGVSKPLNLVEEVFTQHGFQRKGSKEEPVFRMNIQDCCTRQSYSLDIPFKEEGKNTGQIARFGKPYVSPVPSTARTNGVDSIPSSISWAAESKLAEVADYLIACDRTSDI